MVRRSTKISAGSVDEELQSFLGPARIEFEDLDFHYLLGDEGFSIHAALQFRHRRVVRQNPAAQSGFETAGEQNTPLSKPRLSRALCPSMNWLAWALLVANLGSTIYMDPMHLIGLVRSSDPERSAKSPNRVVRLRAVVADEDAAVATLRM